MKFLIVKRQTDETQQLPSNMKENLNIEPISSTKILVARIVYSDVSVVSFEEASN